VRCIGVAQDLTVQRMTHRQLDAHHTVSETLREWDSLDLGVVELLSRLGTALDYRMGPCGCGTTTRTRSRAVRSGARRRSIRPTSSSRSAA
jgi:hypothetical protein